MSININEINEQLTTFLEGEVISFQDYKRYKQAKDNLDKALHINIKNVLVTYCETIKGIESFKINKPYSYEEFQDLVYLLDYYCQQEETIVKCWYTALIDVSYINEEGRQENEETTYEGKLHLGSGQYDVNILINMEQFINSEQGKAVFFDNPPVRYNETKYAEKINTNRENVQTQQNSLIKDYSNKGTKTPQDVEVGDILYTSWGYDMTIVDFYKVIERKPNSIKLQALAHETTTGGIVPTDKPIPDPEVDGKLFRIGKYNVCKLNGHGVYYWSGTPKYVNYMD